MATSPVEYDIAGWNESVRSSLGRILRVSQIPSEFQGDTMLVPSTDESAVDTIFEWLGLDVAHDAERGLAT
jgi:hypothetical protein